MKPLKIGQLAKQAGVTVRTLHHYDAIGLLSPSGDRESGHRLYTKSDVERLSQVVSLKSMGFSLAQMLSFLDGREVDLNKTLAIHRMQLKEKIKQLQKMDEDLGVLINHLNNGDQIDGPELLEFMGKVKKMENIYTPEQVKKLQERLSKYDSQVKETELKWQELFKKFEQAMQDGHGPESEYVQTLAMNAQQLIDLFTGGDTDIEARLDAAYDKSQISAEENWGVSPKVFEFATKARRAFKQKG